MLKSAKKAYIKLKETEDRGEMMQRPRNLERNERRKEKLEKRKNWYGTKYETVLFVPATPNSELQQELQKKINEAKMKI